MDMPSIRGHVRRHRTPRTCNRRSAYPAGRPHRWNRQQRIHSNGLTLPSHSSRTGSQAFPSVLTASTTIFQVEGRDAGRRLPPFARTNSPAAFLRTGICTSPSKAPTLLPHAPRNLGARFWLRPSTFLIPDAWPSCRTPLAQLSPSATQQASRAPESPLTRDALRADLSTPDQAARDSFIPISLAGR